MGENRLWLLAHQDDEILGLHLNSNQVANFVVYLTDGVRFGADYKSDTRVTEAQKAWNQIDGNAELIFFGTDNSLPDGNLDNKIGYSHFHQLISICGDRDIDEIITLQLEGGHQDHDITSLLAEELSKRLVLNLVTFPAYRALHEKFPFYTVMNSTLKARTARTFSWTRRIQLAGLALRLMKGYKSQIFTWIGLGPFVILKYLFGKPSFLSSNELENASHEIPKKILYANRKMHSVIDYEKFRKKISSW